MHLYRVLAVLLGFAAAGFIGFGVGVYWNQPGPPWLRLDPSDSAGA